jgi:formamidopyrimidine-DNA glycosylase
MPELPDLEVFKENIFRTLSSKRLVGLKALSMKITAPEIFLAEELIGRELQNITRSGKELLFDFADGKIISAHLMLNGKISIANEYEKIKSKVFILNFENENLIFHDSGNVGTVIKYKPMLGSAPDAFSENFTLDYFLKTAKKKFSVNIKAFLIDQKIVRGIGNAYADEILYAAKISPKCVVGKIPDEALTRLYEAIGLVLRDAVASIKEISPEIISGEERSFLKVHTKAKKQTDMGFQIKIETIASKTTYFTEEQVVYL